MILLVMRDGNLHQAPDIIDKICSAEVACRERGRNFLDENGINKLKQTLAIPFRNVPKAGAIAEVVDVSTSEVYRAKVLGWTIDVTRSNDNPTLVAISTLLERNVE